MLKIENGFPTHVRFIFCQLPGHVFPVSSWMRAALSLNPSLSCRARNIRNSQIRTKFVVPHARYREESDSSPPVTQTKTASSGLSLKMDKATQGRILLLSVALIWGSYSPALKIAFSGAAAPDPATLTFLKNIISAGALSLLTRLAIFRSNSSTSSASSSSLPSHAKTAKKRENSVQGAHSTSPIAALLNWTTPSVLLAGAELGLWTFGGGALQAVGIAMTTASRAGFLIQSISVLVPLIAFLSGERIGKGTWAACGLGVGGASLIMMDGGGAAHAAMSAMAARALLGDALVLGACVFYALGTVRLTKHAKTLDGVQLAAARQTSMAVFSFAWVAWAAVQATQAGKSLLTLWPGWADPSSWMLVLYVALVTGAMSSLLQTLGQARVGAAQAQVIYSSTPLWSALFSMILIGTDTLGLQGWVGGALIVISGLLSAFGDKKKEKKDKGSD